MEEEFKPTANQKLAINDLDGRLFIAAGAGSGKTAVVARRFVEAIAQGKAEVDQILTITFTKKAAAEMMDRVRDVLRKQIVTDPDSDRVRNMREAYRNIERAHISTIDSFYSRVLRANALAAGIDPDFSPVDETFSRFLKEEAYETCLKDFVLRNQKAGADFVLAYDRKLSGRLLTIINDVHTTFSSRGQEPRLPVPNPEKLIDECQNRLQAAIDGFDEAVRLAGCKNKTVDNIRESNSCLLDAINSSDLETRERLVLAGEPKRGLKKIKTEYDELKNSWAAYLLVIRSQKAVGTIGLMNDLLVSYDKTYRDLKYEKGVLDFADLSLLTRNLLIKNPSIGNRLASSFRLIMVDEFQDTNLLQYEIAEMISNDNLMMVGDKNQSIFGFRDAEVGLFQAEDKKAALEDYRIPLLENFRSQPEILAFVDELFQGEEMLADDYLKLVPMAEIEERQEDCRVEVIMVDQQQPGREKNLSADETRTVEAQLIAEKLLELFEHGYSRGDVAILVETRNGVEVYRDALDRMGIRNYLAIGISFYERLELGDIINMYRLMVNPQDDEALVAVLRSPLVGALDDTLYWLRQTAGRDSENKPLPLWTVLGSGKIKERFNPDEQARLTRFAADLNELRIFAGRNSLQQLARRVIHYNDYAATVATGHKGKQALANLMKLVDLAADYESVWGGDLAAFTEFLVHQKSVKAGEADAPIEEEGVSAVRIMTMHTAKGLEFPLVVLPKLGAVKGGNTNKPVILADRDKSSGRVGLDYRDLDSTRVAVFDYDELSYEKKLRETEEEKRLIYVAMTRAMRHLVLVGCGNIDEPAKSGEDARPFDWIRARLSLDRQSRSDLDQIEKIDELEGVRVGLQVHTDVEDVLARVDASVAEHDLPDETDRINSLINILPEPPIYVPPSISPTALDTFHACPRRYYLERVLHAGEALADMTPGRTATADGELSATEMGLLVHKILENDLPKLQTGSIDDELMLERARQVMENITGLSSADRNRTRELIGNFKRTTIAGELFSAEVSGNLQRELSFSTLVGRTILQGQMDACVTMNDGTLVVDYKTGSIGQDRPAEEAAESYRYQMASYALAAMRMNPGPVRIVLAYLGGDEPDECIKDYKTEEISMLEGELKAVIDSMAAGDFPAIAGFDGHQCPSCIGGPNGAGICA